MAVDRGVYQTSLDNVDSFMLESIIVVNMAVTGQTSDHLDSLMHAVRLSYFFAECNFSLIIDGHGHRFCQAIYFLLVCYLINLHEYFDFT